MKVAFMSAEVEPFCKVGGLADVAGALPKALKKNGVEVKIFVPLYDVVDRIKWELKDVDITPIEIMMGREKETATFKRAILPGSEGVEVILVENQNFFGRYGIYTDEDGVGYDDNDARFVFYQRASLEFLKASGWKPDLIHCNDHQTALIPAYLKSLYAGDPFFRGIKTLTTIHNMGYQGEFPPETMKIIGVDEAYFAPMSPFEYYGKVNFFKVGLYYSDLLNTVSEKYAEEISSLPEYGCGMEGILAERKNDLYGILNGVDYEYWNPEKDDLIPTKYSIQTLDKKSENKQVLLEENGIPADRMEKPVIGMISRLADQKGFDLVAAVIHRMLAEDVTFVLLGTGEQRYHGIFSEVAEKYPDQTGINLTFDNQLAHLIEAGSDMFLMPSRYEPCGLNQMYSLKYGTVPIVRATGGLADTIKDWDGENGNGFVFTEYDPEEMFGAIKRALAAYNAPNTWRQIQINGMREDFSWDVSARKYIELYNKALAK